MDTIVDNLVSKESTNEAVEQWKEEAIPSAMTQTAINHLYKVALEKAEVMPLILTFVGQLAKDEVINFTHCNEAFLKLLSLKKDNSEDKHMATLAAWAVENDICDLKDMSEATMGHYPVYFLALQHLTQVWDNERLFAAFEASGMYCHISLNFAE